MDSMDSLYYDAGGLDASYALDSLDPSQAAMMQSFLGIGGIVMAVILALVTILSVYLLIGRYRMYEKMGEPGWKMFIPLYSEYLLYQHVWNPKMLIAEVALAASATVLLTYGAFGVAIGAEIGSMGLAPIMVILGLAMLIAPFVIDIIFKRKLSASFGRGIGNTLGLVFLPEIFYAVLGYGTAEFTQPDTAVWADIAARRNMQTKKDIDNVQLGLRSAMSQGGSMR